ncbi:MAG: helix-turn-helix domain-containing protein [Terrimicrobiaceae bacterium]|nr:helix-turn-helix domain-containing protein [Terrimicrobiaceae bacterium]
MTTQDITRRLALNRVEAARLLGLSPATIDRLTKRGLLRPSRAVRRPLYHVEELERFLRESTDLSTGSGATRIGGTCRGKEVNTNGQDR